MDHKIDFEIFYRALKDITVSVHSDINLKEIMDTVVQKSAEALGAKGALIRIMNLVTNELDIAATYGLSDKYLSKGIVSSEKILTSSSIENKVIIIDDILDSPRLQYPEAAWEEGIRMVIDAPLNLGSDVVGILRFYFTEQRTFTEEELNFIIPIAEQGAYVIQKVHMLETQQSRYDQLVLRTEKLSALGRMAAGIAHEINNPLAGILLYSSSMLKKVSNEAAIKEGLEIIAQETIRCKTIIQELLDFSRESEPEMTMHNINAVSYTHLTLPTN